VSARAGASLPAQVTSFVGRSAELEALANLVRTSRLVTITGAAGMGKTRLAIEVAGRIDGDAGTRVRFVSLAALADGELLAQEVASRLAVPEQPGVDVSASLADHIGEQRMLLVVDNCEHLVDACAQLIETLLRGCPNLNVLATSLQPLRVPGEVVWRIAPLSLPGRRPEANRRAIAVSEAARLFVERARLVQPDFALEPANADAVASVCRRLEGIPLAIELAAALMEAMSVQDVLTRLDDRFRLFGGDGRPGAARHRTLHAALDWGHQLLDEQERRLFRRLSVFGGGFDVAACEAVCAGDGLEADDVGGLVFRLVERSLIQPDLHRRGPARYRLLEPIRQYAIERLVESGEQATAAERHAVHFLALAERAEREERGEDQPGWLERLEAELDNLRAALSWFRAHDSGWALGMASALSWFWTTRGHFTEGRAWLEGALAAAPDAAPQRARALLAAARVTFWQGDYPAAQAFCEGAADLFERRGEAVDLGWALTLLGSISAYQGDYEQAAARFDAALESTGHDLVHMEALVGVGEMLLLSGDLPGARARLGDVLRLVRGPDGPRGRAALFLGIVAILDGDNSNARAQLAWGLEIFQRLGNRYAAAASLDALATLALGASDPLRALRLCGAAAALRASTRSQLAPRWRQMVRTVIIEPASAAAGDRAEPAWAEGERMTFEEAVRYAKSELPVAVVSPEAQGESAGAAAPARQPAGLTPRELEVAQLVARGLTNRQIADRLVLSERTIEGHVERIRGKLGVRSRTQIAASIIRERAWPTSLGD
jgi:non-specific serine/threonine protein kinase